MHLSSRGMKTPTTKSHLGGNEEKSSTSPAEAANLVEDLVESLCSAQELTVRIS